jgi:hypothetical protein
MSLKLESLRMTVQINACVYSPLGTQHSLHNFPGRVVSEFDNDILIFIIILTPKKAFVFQPNSDNSTKCEEMGIHNFYSGMRKGANLQT